LGYCEVGIVDVTSDAVRVGICACAWSWVGSFVDFGYALAFSKLLNVIFFALQSLFCIQGVFVILPLSVDLGISSA